MKQERDSNTDDGKPDHGWRLYERDQRKPDNSDNAACDVKCVTHDAIGKGVERSSQHLAQTYEHQRYEDKEHRDDEVDWNGELRHIGISRFRSEKYLLWRN